MSGYIEQTDHLAAIAERMDQFEKALVKRWRREIAERVNSDEPIVTSIVRNTFGNPVPGYLAGQFTSAEWSAHKTYCGTMPHYLEGGDPGDAGRCEGWLDPNGQPVEVENSSGEMVAIGPKIDCPLDAALAMVDQWAVQERSAIEPSIPKFQGHDVAKLESAYDAAKKLREATLAEYTDVDISQGGHRDLAGGGDLPGTVAKIWSKDSESRDWWVGWTGLAADHVRGNFCTSAGPTLMNHSVIATALGNLVTTRAAIIEAGRNNGLHLIERATAALGEVDASPFTETEGWKSVQSGLDAFSLWSALGGPLPKAVAAALKLLQFLGDKWFAEVEAHTFADAMVDIVTGLVDGFIELNDQLDEQEAQYREAAASAMEAINDAASFDLELYDLTENTPGGTDSAGSAEGYTVDISNVLTLAEHCELAGEDYEGLLRHFEDLFDAEPHLADKDGDPTAADKDVKQMFADFKGFVKTTSARYYLAHEEIRAAAEAYAQVDEDSAAAVERTLDSWDRSGVGEVDPGFDVDRAARPTERDEDASDNPYNGELDGDPNYYTELNLPR
ncbi:hypothetical protein [Glycomyces tenuis]|uniref:hypothetical protein n=1 Tax=Glycomyces tenuis TaxID=58116 RepID=UPI0004105F83|nr:hypothetical protein [Glycomyces tenuis]